jgi:hypothetical protein
VVKGVDEGGVPPTGQPIAEGNVVNMVYRGRNRVPSGAKCLSGACVGSLMGGAAVN